MLVPGTRLGAYEILSAVGAGGMGEVYRASDLRLDRVVAIKVVSESVAQRPDFHERFERESKILARLNHPHICTVFDVGCQDGVNYLVMEYVEGVTLAERLGQGRVSRSDALLWGMQIADALDQSHRRGITHRDLKPSNVMLTRSGVKLLDFGLAKNSISETGLPPSHLTGEGTLLGTVPYMAPEQLTAANTDARTDVFALGTILYEMFTGVNPFVADTRAATIAAVLAGDPPEVSPSTLNHVLQRCVAKLPDERWQTARDVMLELEFAGEVADGPIIAAPKPRRTAWILTLAAALLLACFLAYLALHRTLPSEISLSLTAQGKEGIGSFAVSPDGKKAVLTGVGSMHPLWIKSFDSPDARVIEGAEDASYPFWSPDSESIGFFAKGKLKKISISGGAAQVLADAPVGVGGTWNRDGLIIFSPNIFVGLSTISASGGEAAPLTTMDPSLSENSHRWPQFLPDQRHYLYMIRSANSGIYLGELGTTKHVRLLENRSNAIFARSIKDDSGYLVFSRDNALMAQRLDVYNGKLQREPIPLAPRVSADALRNWSYLSASLNGTVVYQQFIEQSAENAELKQVVVIDELGMQHGDPIATGLFSHLNLPAQGSEIAVQRTTAGGVEILSLNRRDRTEHRLAINKAFPVWSRDGTRILMMTFRAGLFGFQCQTLDGASVSPVWLESKQQKLPLDWLPGDQWILYQASDDRSKSDLFLTPADGSQVSIPYIHSPANETDGQFSPDGRWLAYVSDESGVKEVYVQRFLGPTSPPGPRWAVSQAGGVKPRWRRNGKEIYFLDPQQRMMAASVGPSLSAFEAGSPKPLFVTRLSWSDQGQQYDVSPNSKTFLMLQPANETNLPLTVLMNWNGGARPFASPANRSP